MKFIAITRSAAEHLASDRLLQSCEFSQGLQFAEFLSNIELPPPELSRVQIYRDTEGISLLATREDSPGTLVLDLEQAELFMGLVPTEVLLVFQKIIRFALRNWSNQKLAASEMPIKGTSRFAVFPFPISTQTSFRVVVETSPQDERLKKRLEKRPHFGRCLVAYAAGTDEKCGSEGADIAGLRKAIEAIGQAKRTVEQQQSASKNIKETQDITAVGLTRLSPPPAMIDGHLGFDNWERRLTTAQRQFVSSPLTAPHRIEGPAGTGKTISLVLRAIWSARNARTAALEKRILFLAHSEATRRTIRALFDANDSDQFVSLDHYASPQSIRVTTLHELCAQLLGGEISESEFLDRDALESKNTQLLYVNDALDQVLKRDYDTYKPFLSSRFAEFVESEDRWKLALMLQHEISVVIKGRAQENFDSYKKVPTSETGLPISTESDRGFVFIIYKKYQEMLGNASAFDTDDVVLSALAQLNTPIWRRRRVRDGYDAIFVDETHLFNLNELSVLHYLTRSDSIFPIAYSADPSQALADRGWSDQLFDDVLRSQTGTATTTKIKAVFRCSPDIINLALSVTGAGATLFGNFDNSLRDAKSIFTEEEERLASPPVYINCPTDSEMIITAFQRAESMATSLQERRSSIAVVIFDETLFGTAKRIATETNKPVEILSKRGDIDVIYRASHAGRFVLTMPDYVGGLEFSGVVLVGVDRGRVPETEGLATTGSAAFLTYQAHSRLYVAITRARFRVEILGNIDRGPSEVLKAAIQGACIGTMES